VDSGVLPGESGFTALLAREEDKGSGQVGAHDY